MPNCTHKTSRLHMRIDADTLDRIDGALAGRTRSQFVCQAIDALIMAERVHARRMETKRIHDMLAMDRDVAFFTEVTT